MESIVNISLAGSYIFPIESNACRVLQEYLETLQDRVKEGEEGKEILQSIEERIVELFSEYTQEKTPVTLATVQKVIQTIGSPDDIFQDEKSTGANNRTARTEPMYRARLYRDPDKRVLGGVCAGLAARLNLPPWLVRILFLVFAFFYGITILIYIVLWIAIPKARTPLQKMELHQEPITFSTIEGSVRKEYQAMRENRNTKEGNGIGNFFSSLAVLLGSIALAILKYSIYVVGGLLIVGSIVSVLALAIGLITGWAFIGSECAWGHFLHRDIIFSALITQNGSLSPILFFSALLFLLLLAFFLGIYCLIKRKIFLKISAITFVLWLLSTVGLILNIAGTAMRYRSHSETETQYRLELKPADTLVLAPFTNEKRELQKPLGNTSFHDLWKRRKAFREEMSMQVKIEPTSEPYGYIEVEKEARGATIDECEMLIDAMHYEPIIRGTRVELPACYQLTDTDLSHAICTKVTIYVPSNTYIRFDGQLPWSYVGWDMRLRRSSQLAKKIWYNSGTYFVVSTSEPFDSLIEDIDTRIE